jgi:uncharacterized delta-60 repeat protein
MKPLVPRSVHLPHSLRSNVAGWLAAFTVISLLAVMQSQAQDGLIRFQSAQVTVSEGVGIAFIGLERTTAEAGPEVTIQTVADTALAGVDYHPVQTTYTFTAGETAVSLIVQIFDNAQFQSDRQFKITLSNPVNLTIGSPAEVTVTIADNDEPTKPGWGAAGTNTAQGVYTLATNSTGGLIAGGLFRTYNGELKNHLVRLQPGGELDASFNPGTGPDGRVWALAVQSDDRLLVAGDFQNFHGTPSPHLARVLDNGSLDPAFTPGTGADGRITSIEVLTDDRILIAGGFNTFNGASRSDVALLLANGTLDNSFNAVTPPSFFGYVARRHADGILVGGTVGGTGANVTNSLMRFDLTGVRDTSFQVSVGDIFLNLVSDIVVAPDNKIVICGNFRGLNGNPTGSTTVARLNANGTPDNSFNVGLGANDWVLHLVRLTDGKFLIAGFFTSFDGVPRAGIARLNANGSLDLDFALESGANDAVYAVLPQGNGDIYLGGAFSRYDQYDRFRLAEVKGDGTLKLAPPSFLASARVAPASVQLTFAVEPGRDFRVLSSSTLTDWSPTVTNRTARRSFQLTVPASSPAEFFQIEQPFPTP